MVTSWSLATTSQALRHADGMVSHVAGAIRQELTNDYDMQYLANFQVGGQAVWAIPDSGSQEVVCVTDKCGSCGDNSDGHLYSPSHSSSREECQASRVQVYGSGYLSTTLSKEDICFGGTCVHLSMWEVHDGVMPLLQTSVFSLILGLGPVSSTEEPSCEDGVVSDSVMTSFQRESDINVFSFCIGSVLGSPGYLTWNDPVPRADFYNVPVLPDYEMWMTPVTDIKLGETAISCGAGTPCLAIFDTGTSLLAASGHIKTSLVQQLAFANCSSIDSIPSLHFKLAGMSFSLPPEAFMGNVVGGMVGDAEELVASGDCVPLFVEMTDEIDGQSLLILGLPFFRKFYTLFQQHPRSVMVAQANEDCTVRSGSWDLLDNEATKEHVLMSVNVTKLLPPRFRAKRDVRHGRQGSHE